MITFTLVRRRAFVRALSHVGAVAVLLELAWLAFTFTHPSRMGGDGVQVWFQAERILNEQPLYSPMPDFGPDVSTGDLYYPMAANSPYPPPAASVVALLPRVEMETFARIVHVLLLGAFWTFAAILGRLASGRWALRPALAAHAVLFMWPGAILMLLEGNWDPVLWCLFGSAFLHPVARGAALAAMTAVKVHAVWPLLFLTTRRPRASVASAAPAATALVLLTVLAMGAGDALDASVDWVRWIGPAVAQGTFSPWNVSLSFFPLRVIRWMGWEYAGGPLPDAARVWLSTASVIAPLAAGWLARRQRIEIQMAAVMAAALLAAPLCWMGYLTALFAPVAWCLGPYPAGGGGSGPARPS